MRKRNNGNSESIRASAVSQIAAIIIIDCNNSVSYLKIGIIKKDSE